MGITLRRRGWFRAPARCRSLARAMPVGGPHRENWPALHGSPGDGRSRPSASCWHRRVIGAGFALPRDAGRRPPPGRTGQRSSDAGRRPPPGELAGAPRLAWRWASRGLRPRVGMTLRRRGWFRAPARCRSETGAPSARLAMGGSRPSASRWHDAASLALVSRSRAMPVGDRRSFCSPGDGGLAAFGLTLA